MSEVLYHFKGVNNFSYIAVACHRVNICGICAVEVLHAQVKFQFVHLVEFEISNEKWCPYEIFWCGG